MLDIAKGLNWIIVSWSRKIIKGIEGNPPPLPFSSATLAKYEKATLTDALKKSMSTGFLTLALLHLMPNWLNGVSMNGVSIN